METVTSVCPACSLPVLAEFYFCPNCGRQIRPKPIIVSLGRQIGVYCLSFFLAPLGLHTAIKYIRQPNPHTKVIGVVAVMLTVLAISLAWYTYFRIFQQITSQYPQLQIMQLLGS